MAAMALMAVPILAACGRVTVGPATLLPVPLTGSWAGQTSQGEPLSFDVTNDLVRKFSIEYVYSGSACTVSKASIRADEMQVSVGQFTVGQGSDKIDGRFKTNKTASGTAHLVPPATDRPACQVADITWKAHWTGR